MTFRIVFDSILQAFGGSERGGVRVGITTIACTDLEIRDALPGCFQTDFLRLSTSKPQVLWRIQCLLLVSYPGRRHSA